MKVTIDVHLVIAGARTMLSGDFSVYKHDHIPVIAYDWIKKIRRETGYYGNQSIIEKVIYNGDQDITDKVKEIDAAPIPDLDLPW
jgi:hypothetical protein